MQKNFLLVMMATLMSFNLSAQENENYTKTLSRLLIKNEKNEILVIKLKEGFWVTPALYHKERRNLRESLSDIMLDYGVEITSPKLKGVFFLDVEFNQTTCFRLFFEARTKSGDLNLPENMEEMKWVPIEEAATLLTFSHITKSLQQIEKYPDKVWGGSFRFYKENNELVSELTDEFYTLN